MDVEDAYPCLLLFSLLYIVLFFIIFCNFLLIKKKKIICIFLSSDVCVGKKSELQKKNLTTSSVILCLQADIVGPLHCLCFWFTGYGFSYLFSSDSSIFSILPLKTTSRWTRNVERFWVHEISRLSLIPSILLTVINPLIHCRCTLPL